MLEDGSEIAIEKLSIGTHVLQRDPKTGSFQGARVEDVKRHTAPSLVCVQTCSGRKIWTTPGHFFYRADSASWASVEGALDQPNTRLRPGNQLLTHARTGKATEEVVGLTSKEGSAQVYSLTVGGLHCYFASGVLVHNACTQWWMGAATCGLAAGFASLVVGWASEKAMAE